MIALLSVRILECIKLIDGMLLQLSKSTRTFFLVWEFNSSAACGPELKI